MDIWYIIYNFHEHINYNCAPVHPCAVTLNKWIHFQKSCKSMKSSANLGSQTSLSVRDGRDGDKRLQSDPRLPPTLPQVRQTPHLGNKNGLRVFAVDVCPAM